MEEAQATVTAPCALILAQTSAENQETVDAWFRRDFESTNLEPKGIVSGASKGCACNWTAQIACGLPVHVTIDAMCDSDVMCTQFLRLFFCTRSLNCCSGRPSTTEQIQATQCQVKLRYAADGARFRCPHDSASYCGNTRSAATLGTTPKTARDRWSPSPDTNPPRSIGHSAGF